MSGFQAQKAVVRSFHAELAAAAQEAVTGVLARHVTPDWHWRGVHPFNEQRGAEAIAAAFWAPLMESFTRLQRRPDIFLAGLNEADGFRSVWVLSMGHLMGLFDRPWLGIRPTKRITMLRYAEFNRVEDGRIAETAMFCDIPGLMIQAGQNPFPPQTGAHLIYPGPATHDGLMWEPQDPELAPATLAALERMLASPGRHYYNPDEARLLMEVWHDDMVWWGPAGIGASYTIPGYMRRHTRPFDDAFSKGGDAVRPDLCRVAEGRYGGLFGYANMTVRNAGGFLGMTAGPGPADMRVVDIYREEGGKLAENWVFIDLLHYLNMQGLDVLARMESVQPVLQ
jgi:ketosteroid isomerase-like protein